MIAVITLVLVAGVVAVLTTHKVSTPTGTVQNSTPAANTIPQNGGGDHDGDNSGGPDDGDGAL
jgi:hypothetical protein